MYPNPRMQNWNAQPVPRLAQKEPEEEDFLRFEEDEDQEPEDHVTKQLKKAKGKFTQIRPDSTRKR